MQLNEKNHSTCNNTLLSFHKDKILDNKFMIIMKHQDENIKEAKAHMQYLKTAEKKHYNQIKNLIKQFTKTQIMKTAK